MVADALRAAHGWAEEAIEIVPITTSGDRDPGPAARRSRRQGAVDQGARPLPARRPHRPVGPFDEGRRDDPAGRARHRRDAAARRRARPADRRRQPRRAARRARGSAPPRRAAPRNCWRGGPTSRSCRSAATSRPGSPSSSAARPTRPCSPPPGLDRLGLDDSASPLDLLPAPAQGAIGVEIAAGRARICARCWSRDRPRADARGCVARRARLPRRARRRLPLRGRGAAPTGRTAIGCSAEILSADGREVHARRGRRPGRRSRRAPARRRRARRLRAMFGRVKVLDPPPAARRRRDGGARPRAGAGPGRRAAVRGPAARLDAARPGRLRRGDADQRQRRAPGGDGLTPFLGLPCYAVGEATAAAAREAGFADIRIGPGDGAALLAMMADDGIAPRLPSLRPGPSRARPSGDRGHAESRSMPPRPSPAPARGGGARTLVALLHSPRAARAVRGARRATRASIRDRGDQRADGARRRASGWRIGRGRRRAARPGLAGACRQAVPE